MCDILYTLYNIHSQRFCTYLQRLKHHQYSKNAKKIPHPKLKKVGKNEKKSKKFLKIGWANAHVTGNGRSI